MAKILVGSDASGVSKHLAETLETAWASYAQTAANSGRPFVLGLSGGSLPKFLVGAIGSMPTFDWSKIKFIFCDERLVSFEDGDSTYKVYRDTLVPALAEQKKVTISEEAFVRIDTSLNDSAADSAVDYANKLAALGVESYDALLLGMGPDGHTCSLFPGHKLLDEATLKVAPITDSPKPPASRITLTYPVINSAQNCVFVSTGEGKKEILKKILEDKEDFPAGRVQPKNGNLVWILDAPAASLLKL